VEVRVLSSVLCEPRGYVERRNPFRFGPSVETRKKLRASHGHRTDFVGAALSQFAGRNSAIFGLVPDCPCSMCGPGFDDPSAEGVIGVFGPA
jgi:hypothetical protein